VTVPWREGPPPRRLLLSTELRRRLAAPDAWVSVIAVVDKFCA